MNTKNLRERIAGYRSIDYAEGNTVDALRDGIALVADILVAGLETLDDRSKEVRDNLLPLKDLKSLRNGREL